MDRFLVISPHEAGECKAALYDVMEAGYITHFDWGCSDNDHTGWIVLEASDAKEAMMVVPSKYRHRARAVKLVKFSPEQITKSHKDQK